MLEEKVYQLVQPKIDQMGYELVRIKYFDNTQTLQIMIDLTQENTRIGIEDCARVSQEISVILDVEDFIGKQYSLEITSAGLDRPLLQIADFKKYKGCRIKLLLKEMINGIKKCKGTILDVKRENILFRLYDTQEIEIPFIAIESANLLVSEKIFQDKQNK